jgi:hypothetical protein
MDNENDLYPYQKALDWRWISREANFIRRVPNIWEQRLLAHTELGGDRSFERESIEIEVLAREDS